MMIPIRIERVKTEDVAILQMVVIMLAFKDYSKLAILSQCLAFAVTVVGSLHKSKGLVSRSVAEFAVLKILFLIWCFVSWCWAYYPPAAIDQSVTVGLRFMSSLTIVWYVNSEERRDNFLRYVVAGCCILCFRLAVTVPLDAWGNQRVGIYLAHDQRNRYGHTGITYVLGLAGVFILTDRTAIRKSQVRILLVIVFSVLSLLSGSKKQMFFLLIWAIVVSVYGSRDVYQVLKRVLGSALLAVGLCVLLLKVDLFYNAIGERFLAFLSGVVFDTGVEADASTVVRISLLKRAWKVFLKHPLWGVGIGCLRYVPGFNHAWSENNLLELLASGGIIGAVLFYLPHVVILLRCMKNVFRKNISNVQIVAALLCLVVVEVSMVTYANSTIQFYFAFLYACSNVVTPLTSQQKLEQQAAYR